jgi:hypothetical protein
VTVLVDLLAALKAEVSDLRGEMTAFMTELRAMRTAELAALAPAGAAAAEPVAVSEVTEAMQRELALQVDQERGTGYDQQWQWEDVS